MSLRSMLATALLGLLWIASPPSVSACDCDGGGWGYYALNYHRLPLRTGNVPSPPYFALHPPVYYSGLQSRPYGDSPFAFRARRPSNADAHFALSSPSAAKIIENPHYQPEAPAEGGTTTGLMIINPYYEADGDELAKSR